MINKALMKTAQVVYVSALEESGDNYLAFL